MKALKIFLITAFIFMTIISGVAKTKLHKPFVIVASDFKLQRYSEKVQPKQIVYDSNKVKKRDVKIEPSDFATEKIETKIISSEIPAEAIEPPKEIVKETEDNVVKPLNKREEQIAWNKWRSDIQNEIMMQSQVDGSLGTFFYFSFKVDKYRHISNIKVFCSNPLYLKEASEKITAVIEKLEYSQLLEFPKGSERESTTVKGMFGIGLETTLSNPGDFNDFERVNVYE